MPGPVNDDAVPVKVSAPKFAFSQEGATVTVSPASNTPLPSDVGPAEPSTVSAAADRPPAYRWAKTAVGVWSRSAR